MAQTDAQRIAQLERQVRFLQQRVPVSGGSAAALQGAIDAVEAAVAVIYTMLDIGDGDGMMGWGESNKANAINYDSPRAPEAGYDREEDRVFAGGQVLISTLGDAATILMARMEVDPGSNTGWPQNQGVARIDWAAIDKNSAWIFPNGADNAFACVNAYLHFPDDGDTPADAWSSVRIQCLRSNHSTVTKPPLDVLYVSGEDNGDGTSGRVEAYWYEADGTRHTVVLSP